MRTIFDRAARFILLLAGVWLLAASAVQAASGGPALWRVDGGATTVYLLGTIHLLPPDSGWRSPAIGQAVAEADSLWLEVDQAATQSPAFQSYVMARGFDRDGPGLPALLDDDLAQRLDALSRDLGVPLQALAPMRPWFAAVTLVTVFSQRQGYGAQHGVEAVLEREFVARGRPVKALETPEQAIAALADRSDGVQQALLADTIDQLADGGQVLADLTAAWLTGDVAQLDALALAPLAAHEEAYEALLIARNKAWLPKIEHLIAGGGVHLVAVGTAHLIGGDGLIAMLLARGHSITRLADKP